jgi:hypothetical protein
MATTSTNVITPNILPPLNNTQITSNIPANKTLLSRPPPLTLHPLNPVDFEYTVCNNEEIETSIIRNVDDAINHCMCSYAKMHIIATKSAIEMHNQWRKVYIQQNGNIPCIKKTKEGNDVDINVDGNLICYEFLEFNYNINIFVATCIHFYPCKSIEDVSSIIHRKWLMMNPSAIDGPLDVPYNSLPEIEKDKKRNIFRTVSEFI